MTTLEDRLVLTRNRPAGFDWMRITLAIGIVAWHTIITSYGRPTESAVWGNPIFRPVIASLLAMFFALSGFLVSSSLEKCRTPVSFVGLRVMRIFPALVVEVCLCAMVLGPVFTEFSMSSYFQDWEFINYFGNTVGRMHYTLPGVFLHNQLPDLVNAQLWTVPFELRCYEVLLLVSILGLYRRAKFLMVTLAIATAFLLSRSYYGPRILPNALQGDQLVLCFLMGVGLFRLRKKMVWNGWIAAASCVISALLLSLPGCDSLASAPMAYLTVYLGLLNPPRAPLLFSGDYSYGLFLYGFPIQQAISATGVWAHHWYVSLFLALPAAACIAVASWWLVEKPVLSKRAWLIRLEDRVITTISALRPQSSPHSG